MNEHGYRVKWAKGSHGRYFNGYAPSGKHIEASYDGKKVKAACDAHLEKQKERAA